MREVIWPSVRAAFVPFSAPLEGAIPHLYLDVKCLVTIAIGVLVDPLSLALTLPLFHADGSRASQDEIAAEWRTVKARRELAHQGHRAAGRLARMRLTPAGVESVTLGKLDAMVESLARRFPDIVSWPAPAQLATLSLAWACGAGFRFPKLEQALRRQSWATAAVECQMRVEDNPGLIPRNAANRALYLEAAESLTAARDPREIVYRLP